MNEFGGINVWKEHRFNGKYKSYVPPGENSYSGPCLRNSLFQAGIYTDLPHWTRREDVEAICGDLGLKCFSGAGTPVTLNKKGKYIIGYIVDREKRVGHFEYTTDIEKTLKHIDQRNTFAFIKIPQR